MLLPRNRHQGFTLIEIMVVVTIIGIMTGVIALNVFTGDPQKEIDREILRLKAVVEMAQEEALFSQQEIGIVLDEESYKFVRWTAKSAVPDDKIAMLTGDTEALDKELAQDDRFDDTQREMIKMLAGQIAAQHGDQIKQLASSGLSLSGEEVPLTAEWSMISGEPSFREYVLDEDFEMELEVDHEQIDLTGGVDEEELEKEAAKDADKILEEEEELEPAIFILSSGELSPFSVEMRLKEDSEIRARLSGDETGRLWIGEDDEFDEGFDDDF